MRRAIAALYRLGTLTGLGAITTVVAGNQMAQAATSPVAATNRDDSAVATLPAVIVPTRSQTTQTQLATSRPIAPEATALPETTPLPPVALPGRAADLVTEARSIEPTPKVIAAAPTPESIAPRLPQLAAVTPAKNYVVATAPVKAKSNELTNTQSAAQVIAVQPPSPPAVQPAAKPIAAKPPAAKPVAAKPVAAKPVATKPVTPPAVTKPPVQPSAKPPVNPTLSPDLAVTILDVQISGVDSEIQQILRDRLATQPGRQSSVNQIRQDLATMLETELLATANFTTQVTDDGVNVQFQATPMIVKRLELRNAQVLPAPIAQQIFQPQIGQAIQPTRLDQGVRSINQWYAENGYSLARAIDVEPNRDGTLKLTVKEGTIDELTIRFVDEFGRTVDDAGKPIKGKTKESFIRQEIKAKPGEIFQAAKIQADLQNLLKTGLFINANASLEGDENKTRVVYNVAEGNNRQANLGGGYSSDSGLFGALTYNDANLAGQGNQLGGRLLVGSKDIQFNGKFTKPFRESDPQRWGYSINAFRERGLSRVFDDDVLLSNGDAVREGRIGAGLGLTKALGSGWNGTIDLNYARTSQRDASGNVVQTDGLGNPLSVSGRGIDDQVTLGFTAGFNRTDNPIDPKSGSKLQLSTEQGVPIGIGSTFSNKLSAEYTQYVPVNLFNKNKTDRDKQEVLAFNIQGGTTIGTLAPYKAFTLGGVNSVRGYGQGELGIGRSYVQASAEYRVPLISALSGAVFADFATDLGSATSVPGAPGNDRGRPGSGFGAGVGLRYKSPLGVLRADWGFTDGGSNRLQFTIGQKF